MSTMKSLIVYSVIRKTKGGRSLLSRYSSLNEALQTSFPGSPLSFRLPFLSYQTIHQHYKEFTWHPWNFEIYPVNVWSNCRKYFDWLSEELGIEIQHDWYSYDGVHLQSLQHTVLNSILQR